MNAIRLSLTVAAFAAASPAFAQDAEAPAAAPSALTAAVDLSCGDISTLEDQSVLEKLSVSR